jgi:hypothetical protein
MKIDLPVVEHMIKVLVESPKGDCVKILDSSHRSFEIDLPDNVFEADVEVTACKLDVCGHVVGEVIVLKEALLKDGPPKPEENNDEDAPVETDEADPKSPSDEVADEKADEEVTCGPKILLDPVTSAPVIAKEEKPVKYVKKPRRVR